MPHGKDIFGSSRTALSDFFSFTFTFAPEDYSFKNQLKLMKKKMSRLYAVSTSLMLFLALYANTVFAQDKIIGGKVSTADGKAIAGVSVQEKGKTGGTFTNETGDFSLKVTGDNPVLLFSYIGYTSRQVTVGNQTQLTIQLSEENKQLSEVVVTAYGVRKEAKRLGYSVQQVQGADLIKARDANPINSLAGKVAGLTVGANSEMLGALKSFCAEVKIYYSW